jgi:hypothetical protein
MHQSTVLVVLTHVSLERISQRSHSHWGPTTKRTMTNVQCGGCHSWFVDNGYLFRHLNSTPQCLAITEQVQEVELERGSQHMKEGVEEDSKMDSMAAKRIMAERSMRERESSREKGCTMFMTNRAKDKAVHRFC